MPGLFFNQRIKLDSNPKYRFFNLKSANAWQLSKDNECYICEKHRYTVVFYDRNFMALNEDLIEIKNQEFLRKLKKDFLGNYSKFYSMAPIICGSIVNRAIGQENFDRKLKMVKASIFSLFQLMSIKKLGMNGDHKKVIAEAMQMFLQNESYHLLRQLNINEKLEGWEKLIKESSLNNELFDVKNINLPDFSNELRDKDVYMFAASLKPGYHQLLIYDPQLERAFCKDFVVNLNQRGVFPEFPSADPEVKKKRIANVWRNW